MACSEWNVDPMRSQSLVPILGAAGESERWRMSPPDLLTMNRCRKTMFSEARAMRIVVVRGDDFCRELDDKLNERTVFGGGSVLAN